MPAHLNPIDPLDRWTVATRGFGGPLRIVDSANKTVCREVRSLSDAHLLKAAATMATTLRDVAAMLPVAPHMHPDDLAALQARVVAAVAFAEGRS